MRRHALGGGLLRGLERLRDDLPAENPAHPAGLGRADKAVGAAHRYSEQPDELRERFGGIGRSVHRPALEFRREKEKARRAGRPLPFLKFRGYAKATPDRLRIALPTAPKPRIIRAQVAGSGTTPGASVP